MINRHLLYSYWLKCRRGYMSKMIFNQIYLFSIKEKKARTFYFHKGINIITSNSINGTKRGKSIILKSLYYALGAECFFDDKWNINDKVVILDFSINDTSYYIFRHQRLFKIFLKDSMQEIFHTIHWFKLSEFLGNLYGFSVELPNQETGKMERTPVVYNYILNYIDQDHMDGSKFSSFRNLGHYSDFKEKVLYYHFNIYNQEYYKILHEIDRLNDALAKLNKSTQENKQLLIRINKNINNNDYSETIDNLYRELEQSKAEYLEITALLAKSKKRLINFRNEREELNNRLAQIELFKNNTEKDIQKIIKHECPVCHNEIIDLVDERIKKYNSIEDVLYMKLQLEATKLEVDRKIELEEKRYISNLDKLNAYESRMKLNTQEIEDILKYKGYIDIRESLVNDLGESAHQISINDGELAECNKKKRIFENKKKNVNNRYYELMMTAKIRFSLQEIQDDRFKEVKLNFTAGGSNITIATIVWYFTLLKLKNRFNKDAISFPLVIDSPNNVETDDEKKIELLSYVFEIMDVQEQLIVSSLGFNKEDFPNVEFSSITELNNEKYHLLNEEDYNKYFDFLQLFLDDSE